MLLTVGVWSFGNYGDVRFVKHLAYIVAFAALGITILHALAYTARSVDPDGTSVYLRIDQRHIMQVLDHRDTAEAIVLGNSHGDDINFPIMGYEGYTLARAWGDLFETQYYLQYLVPQLPKLETVFIPVSFFTFDWDNASVDKLEIRRTQMYTAIPSWSAIPWDYKNFIVGRGTQLLPFQTILREDNWQGIFYNLLLGEANPGGNQEPQDSGEECKSPDVDELAAESKTRATEQIDFASEIHQERPSIREDTYQVMVEIIQYLQLHNIQPVLFTPPYYEEYTKYYLQNSPDSIDHMQAMMSKLEREFDIIHYDFSQNPEYASNIQLFKDADHLNRCGKQLFSQTLYDSLAKAAPTP
jgi:hypothetical protein